MLGDVRPPLRQQEGPGPGGPGGQRPGGGARRDTVSAEYITEASHHGAKGYLVKVATHQDLVKAIRTTHAGEPWAERKVARRPSGSI